MLSDRNKETHSSLKREIKEIQTKGENIIQTIVNEVQNTQPSTPEHTAIRVNSYIEGLRTEINTSMIAFSTDDNLLTSQFLIEMKKKTEQAEELVAFTKANINDTQAETKRLRALIDIFNEAKSKPISDNEIVKAKHLQKAKDQFKSMKDSLRGLLQSLFPDCHEPLVEVLGDLMRAKVNDNPNGYITKTVDNYKLIGILQDMGIVTQNPYNDREVKLTY